jgi:hypothetical protein
VWGRDGGGGRRRIVGGRGVRERERGGSEGGRAGEGMAGAALCIVSVYGGVDVSPLCCRGVPSAAMRGWTESSL